MAMSHQWTREAWLNEGRRRFGDDFKLWAFQCPMCKNVATPADFLAAGAERGDRAPHECIGRLLNEKDNAKRRAGTTTPCDWAAFGLFRGPIIVTIDDGGEVPAFEFAEGAV